jgi:hypothetical protein
MPEMQFVAWPASSDLKLRCRADGEPPLKYQWLKDGKVLKYRRLDPKYVLETTFLEKRTGLSIFENCAKNKAEILNLILQIAFQTYYLRN